MTWIASIFTGIVCGCIGALGCGYIASKSIEWYDISSYDAGDGYTILAGGFAGLLAAAMIGFLTSRLMDGGFVRGFLAAITITVGLAVAAYGLARGLGDVPPTLDGRKLRLELEFQMPLGWTPPAAAAKSASSTFVTLASVTAGHVTRASRNGWLSVERTRMENERAIVPAVVGVFTTKGERAVTLTIGNQVQPFGFIVPLPASPGPQFLNWSDWLPRKAEDVRFRFRVVPAKN